MSLEWSAVKQQFKETMLSKMADRNSTLVRQSWTKTSEQHMHCSPGIGYVTTRHLCIVMARSGSIKPHSRPGQVTVIQHRGGLAYNAMQECAHR